MTDEVIRNAVLAHSSQHIGMNMNPDSEARRESARQADGKFGTQEHVEAASGTNALTNDKTKTFVEHMIASGNFSPAARDMDVRDAIDQYCESHVETFERKAQMYEVAGVLMRGKYADLVPGDCVDLEPLLRRHADLNDNDDYASNLKAAEYELAEVESVSVDWSGADEVVVWTYQSNVIVPVDADIDYQPNMAARCAVCGGEVSNEGFEGDLCEDCADDQEPECEECGTTGWDVQNRYDMGGRVLCDECHAPACNKCGAGVASDGALSCDCDDDEDEDLTPQYDALMAQGRRAEADALVEPTLRAQDGGYNAGTADATCLHPFVGDGEYCQNVDPESQGGDEPCGWGRELHPGQI